MVAEKSGESSMQAQHRTRLLQVQSMAREIAGACFKIVDSITGTLENGGTAEVQSSVNFLTGAVARIQKDLGVIEHLQQHGARQKKRMRIQSPR